MSNPLVDVIDAWDDAMATANAVFVAYDMIEEAKQSASSEEITSLNTAFSMLMKQAVAIFEQCDIRIGKALTSTAIEESEEEIKVGGTD